MNYQQSNSILIVDDEDKTLKILYKSFTDEGYTAYVAKNVKNAFEILDNNHIDLIISDVMMPEIDGRTFLEKVRRNKRTQNIPFIFLSVQGSTTQIVNGLNLGADDYVPKPFVISELILRVKNILKQFITIDNQAPEMETADLSGNLKEGTIPELIQYLSTGMRSGCLNLGCGQINAKIWLGNGKILAAECGDLKDKEAIYEIFTLGGGQFTFKEGGDLPENRIRHDSIQIILRGMQEKDKRIKEEKTSINSKIETLKQNLKSLTKVKIINLSTELTLIKNKMGQIEATEINSMTIAQQISSLINECGGHLKRLNNMVTLRKKGLDEMFHEYMEDIGLFMEYFSTSQIYGLRMKMEASDNFFKRGRSEKAIKLCTSSAQDIQMMLQTKREAELYPFNSQVLQDCLETINSESQSGIIYQNMQDDAIEKKLSRNDEAEIKSITIGFTGFQETLEDFFNIYFGEPLDLFDDFQETSEQLSQVARIPVNKEYELMIISRPCESNQLDQIQFLKNCDAVGVFISDEDRGGKEQKLHMLDTITKVPTSKSYIIKKLPFDKKMKYYLFSPIFEEWERKNILYFEEVSLHAFTDIISQILSKLVMNVSKGEKQNQKIISNIDSRTEKDPENAENFFVKDAFGNVKLKEGIIHEGNKILNFDLQVVLDKETKLELLEHAISCFAYAIIDKDNFVETTMDRDRDAQTYFALGVAYYEKADLMQSDDNCKYALNAYNKALSIAEEVGKSGLVHQLQGAITQLYDKFPDFLRIEEDCLRTGDVDYRKKFRKFFEEINS